MLYARMTRYKKEDDPFISGIAFGELRCYGVFYPWPVNNGVFTSERD